MSHKNLKLDQNLPQEIKNIINKIYDQAIDSNYHINSFLIEDLLDEEDDLDFVALVHEIIKKNLLANGVKIKEDISEDDEDEDEDEEDLKINDFLH